MSKSTQNPARTSFRQLLIPMFSAIVGKISDTTVLRNCIEYGCPLSRLNFDFLLAVLCWKTLHLLAVIKLENKNPYSSSIYLLFPDCVQQNVSQKRMTAYTMHCNTMFHVSCTKKIQRKLKQQTNQKTNNNRLIFYIQL